VKYRRQWSQEEIRRKDPRYTTKNENYPENRPENENPDLKIESGGLYEPENAIFGLFFRFFGPPGMKKSEKSLNKRVQTTTHKLPLCDGLRSLQTLFLDPVGRS
jgi:hypothetical protein